MVMPTPNSPLTLLLWPIAPCVLLGGVAVFLLLPRPRPFPVWIGGALGGLALLLTGGLLVHTGVSVESVLFYAFAGIAVTAGAMLVTQSNPARAALSFALVVLSTCGLFLLQAAPFLMAATTIIYAGAIIVTFLFVLMLAQQEGQSDADSRSREPLLACVAGFVLLGGLLFVLVQTYANPKTADVLARLEDRVNRAKEATNGKPAELPTFNPDAFFEELQQIAGEALHEPSLARFATTIKQKWEPEWFDARFLGADAAGLFLKNAVAAIDQDLRRTRLTLGDLFPDERVVLSDLSGPAPNTRVTLDEAGNAPMPAENTARLGKSLFTDYLLAVELGGTLLLVATIGAIAIATRREG
jgi:NADH-quinone oxidoreductase subunit J